MSKIYKVTSTGIKVYSTILKNKVVGELKKGAEITTDTVDAMPDILKIKSVNNGKNYYTGVVNKGFIDKSAISEVKKNKTDVTNDDKNTNNENNNTNNNVNTATNNETEFEGDISLLNIIYDSYLSAEEYQTQLSSGIEISNLRGILGVPHQFLPSADPRIQEDENNSRLKREYLGRMYAEKILKKMPLLFMTPGTPSFMTSFSQAQKDTVMRKITNLIPDNLDFDDLIGTKAGKLYTLKYAYVDYFKYVNAMLRSTAIFLGIEDEEVYGSKLGSINWFYAPLDENNEDSTFDNHGLRKILGSYAGSIPIYAETESRITDSFSNGTTQSSLQSTINGLSDTAREINFYIGNSSGALGMGDLYDRFIGDGGSMLENINNVTDTIDSILAGPNILSNITSKLTNILAGGRMQFPEIWSDSSFSSRSYNATMKLVSPSGDKVSVFLNILVPLYHLLAFVLPRSSSSQSYYSPFLVRCYGHQFNIDMGIIVDMSISKGDEGSWTVDGLPTTCEINFTIKDLWSSLSMSKADATEYKDLMSNIDELNYIAVNCGYNIDDPDIAKTLKMYTTLYLKDAIKDKFTMDIYGGLSQYVNQKIHNIFGTFS